MLQLIEDTMDSASVTAACPEPADGESPVLYAQRLGEWFAAHRSREHKKQYGQFFTPAEIAWFMAKLTTPAGSEIRILDPGAGCGILSCAVCEHIAQAAKKVRCIDLDVYETDVALAALLEKSLLHLSKTIERQSVTLTYHIYTNDFILELSDSLCSNSLLFENTTPVYDLCISNPPYFKLSKSDRRAVAALSVIHGQPNIYALFMAVSAAMLKRGGDFVFITPRSFASGYYFKRFRDYFFDIVQPDHIHLFDSRRDGFKKDGVLQEMIIFKGTRKGCSVRENSAKRPAIKVSVSHCAKDMSQSQVTAYPTDALLDAQSQMNIFRLPRNRAESQLVERLSSWPGTFEKYGLRISTGPVVAFRAYHLLSDHQPESTAAIPLLWLHHIQAMKVRWPIQGFRKPQWIEMRDDAEKLYVKNQNLVLVRRFSAKEEERRLVAAPYLESCLPASHLGLENHLNYIYKQHGTLTPEEAAGLALLLNSESIDTYFRVFNGNTQVGATEISLLPLPPLETLIQAGKQALQAGLDMCDIKAVSEMYFEP